MNIILIGIIVYLILQLFLGLYISRFIKSEEDYLLGGRKLGYVLATFSIFATWFGAESCIGTAGTAYESGLSGVTADPFGYGIVLLLMGFFFAIPLYKMNLTTIADFFRIRYSSSTEKLISLLMIPTSILWAAAQIRAFGLILSSSSEIELELSILISALIVISYTSLGGLLADAWTDLIQGIILISGLVILSITIVLDGIDFKNLFHSIADEKLRLTSSNSIFSIDSLYTLEAWMIPICGSLIAQELVSRIFASRSHRVAKRSSIMAGSLYILIGLIPLSLGLIGTQLIPDIEHSEQILPLIAREYFPPILYVIFLGALISAILSTVDSTLLASAALMSHNLTRGFKEIEEKKKIKITRINVVISGIIAYLLATKAGGVYELVKDASAFGSSGIFIAFIFGFSGKFGNKRSALITVLIGSVIWIFLHYIFKIELSYLISLIVSLFTFVTITVSEKYLLTLLPAFRKIISK